MKRLKVMTVLLLMVFGVSVVIANEHANPPMIYGDENVSYSEIQLEDLPTAVTVAVANAYAGYAISKAYKGDDNTYKVKVSRDDVKKVVYYNENGELQKEKEVDKKNRPEM